MKIEIINLEAGDEFYFDHESELTKSRFVIEKGKYDVCAPLDGEIPTDKDVFHNSSIVNKMPDAFESLDILINKINRHS